MNLKNQGSRYKLWEVLLIILALIMLGGSTAIYFTGISLRKYVLGWEDEEGASRLGILQKKFGSLRRQLVSETEFKSIQPGEELFNYDTVVTSPDSNATLRLDDGTVLELGPGTMIRLVFENKLSLGGISRRGTIDVFAGSVTGQTDSDDLTLRSDGQTIKLGKEQQKVVAAAAPARKAAQKVIPSPSPSVSVSPEPSPEPSTEAEPEIQARVVSPAGKSRLQLDGKSGRLEKIVKLSWEVSPPKSSLRVVLVRQTGATSSVEVFGQIVEATEETGSVAVALNAPGEYVVSLYPAVESQSQAAPVAALATSRFSLASLYSGVEILPELVAGTATSSNQYQGSLLADFDITLRWKPVASAKAYQVRMLSAQDKRVLLERTVKGTKYILNKNKLYRGKIFYEVRAKMPGGFEATSGIRDFVFRFDPPTPVQPSEGTLISKASMSPKEDRVLFTWRKTNFTEGYELEVSTDVRFQQVNVRKRVKENFYVLRDFPVGNYWWRVRSYSGDIISPFSATNAFSLVP